MKKVEDGGSAFPIKGPVAMNDFRGMTLRDYFAAKAMQGMLASTVGDETWGAPKDAAETAYVYADAMLKARDA